MADETKSPFRRFIGSPNVKGKRVKILLSKRPVEELPGPKDESGGVLPPSDSEDELIPARKDSVETFDLGTRFNIGPYEYVELGYVARMALDSLAPRDVRDEDLTLLDSLMLVAFNAARNRTVKVSGASLYGVLKLNHKSLTLEPDGDNTNDMLNLVLRDEQGHAPPVVDADGSEWRWKGRELDVTGWAASNTLYKLAPTTGGYVRRGPKRKYVRLSQDGDPRYWPFDTGSPLWKVTDSPSYAAPAVVPRIRFPLRVYGIPRLHSPFESSNIVAASGALWPSFVDAQVTISEWGIHAATRWPEIPRPPVLAYPELLARYTSDMLTVRREVTYFWPGQAPTTETAYEARRVKGASELAAEAIAFGQAHYVAPNWRVVAGGGGLPLTFELVEQKAGHLSAIFVSKGRAYYVWRAV